MSFALHLQVQRRCWNFWLRGQSSPSGFVSLRKELEGIVEDTEKNTQLVLKVNKDFYPVRDCAIHTILKRAGINGTGLKKLEKATYAKVVNYCLQVAKGDALIKVADL